MRPHQLVVPFELVSPRDAIVRIVGDVGCTGTLIADDRVLTAHSCVAMHDGAGLPLARDQPPEQLSVELGGDFLPWGAVRGRAVVAPDCGYVSGDGGIAVVVLSRHVTGVPITEMRLDVAPEDHEDVALFGFGRCPSWPAAIHRSVRDVGPIEAISAASFIVPAALCPGDLGGPVFTSKSALIGVLSADNLDGDGRRLAPVRFTRVDAWRHVFTAASAISRGASAAEVPPYRDCPRLPPTAAPAAVVE